MATTTAPLTCPQGHGPGNPGARFCAVCGSLLGAPALGPFGSAPLTSTVQAQDFAAGLQPAVSTTPAVVAPQIPAAAPAACSVCGGDGARLDSATDVCPECAWVRPLYPGYQLERSVFLWAQDGQAMSKLQKISALHAAVRFASDRVGRPWIESTFNGIRLGPRQLPDVWKQGVLAARILGLSKMPDIYLSGDNQWVTYTFGSDTSAFIILGTAILNNFEGDELLFVLAREMGHCRAGHALWRTVSRFLNGANTQSGILSKGLLNAISPTKLIEGAVDIPLMAWQRQADVTADRAGLLAVGDETLARRVLLAWSIKSNRLLKQVSIEEWMKQEVASDDQLTRFSEMTTSSSMYTTRRLRLLGQAAHEANLMGWSQSIQPVRKKLAPPPAPKPAPRSSPPAGTAGLRVVCTKCQNPMRIPFAVLRGKTSLNVRCSQCENIFTISRKSAAPASTVPADQPPASTGPQP